MLEQDGGPAAVSVSWSELIRETTGRQITPFNMSDPADAALARKIAAAMDNVLPRLNRPDGPVRSAKRLGMIPSLVDDEVQAALTELAGVSCEAAEENIPTTLGNGNSSAYPTFRLVDQGSHRACHLSVTYCPMDQHESKRSLLSVNPQVMAARITSDGTCMLVVLEHNNKPGTELVFLNWELIDLGQEKIRMQTTFEATADEVLLPNAMVLDGRRGRD